MIIIRVSINGHSIGHGYQALSDTGTTNIVGPTKAIKQICHALKAKDDGNGNVMTFTILKLKIYKQLKFLFTL